MCWSFFVAAAAWLPGAAPVQAQAYSAAVANRYINARDWRGLLGYAQQWTGAEPNSADAWLYLGNTYLLGFRRAGDAAAALSRAVALNPNSEKGWHFLGQSEALIRRYAAAAAAFEHAIALDPSDTNYYTNLVDVYDLGLQAHQPVSVGPILPFLQQRAEAGDAKAQSMLGDMYHDGRGVPQNDAIAMGWYEKSAAQGHAYAEYSLGNGYMLGLGGLPQDQAKATAWFVAAARQGLSDAQEAAAVSYVLGRGVARNRQQAIYWLDQAARQGDIYAAGFAKIMRNRNTPDFNSLNEIQGFVEGVFQYCWRDRFPVRRQDLEGPGYEVWQHFAPNWRDSYCQ